MASSGDLKSRSNNQQTVVQKVQISDADMKFIVFCRDLGWGKIELLIKNGKPTMASVIRRDFRFDIG